MSKTENTNPTTSFGGGLLYAVRYYLRDRRVRIALVVLLVGGGLALNWGWVVALGIAPLILGVLPCAVMCAFGLCMMGGKSNACQGDVNTRVCQADDTQSNPRRNDDA